VPLSSRIVLVRVLAVPLGVLACGAGDTTATFGTATKLVFAVQPASGVAGMLAALRVEVRDAQDRLVTSATHSVRITINAPVGMAGQNIVRAVGGVATFSGLSIVTPGTGYTLSASNFLLASATSAAFDISAGAGPSGTMVFSTARRSREP